MAVRPLDSPISTIPVTCLPDSRTHNERSDWLMGCLDGMPGTRCDRSTAGKVPRERCLSRTYRKVPVTHLLMFVQKDQS